MQGMYLSIAPEKYFDRIPKSAISPLQFYLLQSKPSRSSDGFKRQAITVTRNVSAARFQHHDTWE